VQLRRLLRRDLVGAHRAQRELVGREELEEQQPAGGDEGDRAADRGEQHPGEHDVHQAQQQHRHEHPDLEARVATELGLHAL
jgi:hypothetical protein